MAYIAIATASVIVLDLLEYLTDAAELVPKNMIIIQDILKHIWLLVYMLVLFMISSASFFRVVRVQQT